MYKFSKWLAIVLLWLILFWSIIIVTMLAAQDNYLIGVIVLLAAIFVQLICSTYLIITKMKK